MVLLQKLGELMQRVQTLRIRLLQEIHPDILVQVILRHKMLLFLLAEHFLVMVVD
jgi:hypothetical protein